MLLWMFHKYVVLFIMVTPSARHKKAAAKRVNTPLALRVLGLIHSMLLMKNKQAPSITNQNAKLDWLNQ